jgi:pseudo-response regulator 1
MFGSVMSERDEMAVVAKCLQLGAVDYLVKPLRLNEVMNLWTHMWRRRRMVSSFSCTSYFLDLCQSSFTNFYSVLYDFLKQ